MRSNLSLLVLPAPVQASGLTLRLAAATANPPASGGLMRGGMATP